MYVLRSAATILKTRSLKKLIGLKKGALGEYAKMALQNRFMENGALGEILLFHRDDLRNHVLHRDDFRK